MKTKLLFFFILLLFSCLVSAQYVVEEKGDTLFTSKNTSISSKLMIGQNGYYIIELYLENKSTFGKRNGSYSIHKFGKDLKPLDSAWNILPYRTLRKKVQYATILESNLLVFASHVDRKKKEKTASFIHL